MTCPISDFIDERGGPTAVARATGKTAGAVSQWKHKRRLPRTVWPDFLLAYDDLSFERLLDLERRAESRATTAEPAA